MHINWACFVAHLVDHPLKLGAGCTQFWLHDSAVVRVFLCNIFFSLQLHKNTGKYGVEMLAVL